MYPVTLDRCFYDKGYSQPVFLFMIKGIHSLFLYMIKNIHSQFMFMRNMHVMGIYGFECTKNMPMQVCMQVHQK